MAYCKHYYLDTPKEGAPGNDKLMSVWKDLRKAGYRKKRLTVVEHPPDREHTTIRQPYWSGGSRDEYYVYHPATGEIVGTTVKTPTPWPANPAEEEFALHADRCLIEGGTFCGKPATWRIHVVGATARQWGLDPNEASSL